MSDLKNALVLDSTLLDDNLRLYDIGFRNSANEDGSLVVWLDKDKTTREKYLTLETDESCMNNQYVQLNHVWWFEMKHYQFPPRSSNCRHVKPGTYYLVQRMRKNGSSQSFPCQVAFILRRTDPDTEEKVVVSKLMFDMSQLCEQDWGLWGSRLPRVTHEWQLFVVGRFTLDTPAVLDLQVFSDHCSCKYGFCWDYFDILATEPAPYSLKRRCLSAVLKSLKSKECLDQLKLPHFYVDQLRHADAHGFKLSLYTPPPESQSLYVPPPPPPQLRNQDQGRRIPPFDINNALFQIIFGHINQNMN